jgi:anaerobic carbon-monoxide dehydrogenase iron sulfur subunit
LKNILVRLDHCLGCKSCELACGIIHSQSQELSRAFTLGERPVKRIRVETNTARTVTIPLNCRQCQDPKCVQACMTGAMQIDSEENLVINNQEKCVGCWMCVMVCPYGVIFPDPQEKLAVKCDQCLAVGHDPACVKSCPTKALKFLSIEEFSQELRSEFLNNFKNGGGEVT